MSIKLVYSTSTGTTYIELEEDLNQIDLSKLGIIRIDLTQLDSFPELQKLNLTANKLQNIDLMALRKCTNLRELILRKNNLQSIDLTPLRSGMKFNSLDFAYNPLRAIDLTPINSGTGLRELNLRNTQLQNINISPLGSCKLLNYLDLCENQLERIDLAPLRRTPLLKTLYLHENRIQSIDLTPLHLCTRLKSLTLSSNKIETIDLTPLASCGELFQFNLAGNLFRTVDVTPLFWSWRIEIAGGYQMSWLSPRSSHMQMFAYYSHPTLLYPWYFLHAVTRNPSFRNDYRVQHDVLKALGLEDFGFIDNDHLTDILLLVPKDATTDEAKTILTEILLDLVVSAIDKDGSTTGLNLEELVRRHGEIAARAQDLIELRTKEMERVRIGCKDDSYDISEFYLTAYGYDVLTALEREYDPRILIYKSRLTTDSLEISKIFDALGYELKIADSPVAGVNMTDNLRECIWWTVENRGKPWMKIMGKSIRELM